MNAEIRKGEDMEDNLGRRCRELFDSGCYCAESVVIAVAERQGLPTGLAMRMATGFCGGISRTGGLCGALTGGIMALGMADGRGSAADDHRPLYGKVARFIAEFEQRLGSTSCSGLLGCDISTAEGAREFASSDLEARVCAGITEAAGTILETLLPPEATG